MKHQKKANRSLCKAELYECINKEMARCGESDAN